MALPSLSRIPAPPDPILGLAEAFRNDPRPGKINLSSGVFVDESGTTPVLPTVTEAERRILAKGATKLYRPIDGDAAYRAAVQAFELAQLQLAGRVVAGVADHTALIEDRLDLGQVIDRLRRDHHGDASVGDAAPRLCGRRAQALHRDGVHRPGQRGLLVFLIRQKQALAGNLLLHRLGERRREPPLGRKPGVDEQGLASYIPFTYHQGPGAVTRFFARS